MPIGGGGPFTEADDTGLSTTSPVFLKFAIDGTKADVVAELCGPGLAPGRLGAAPDGGVGAAIVGGFDAEFREDSGSDVYDDSRFAELELDRYIESGIRNLPPVSIPPPRFFNFGIPPANNPANCGGCSIPDAPPLSLLLWSLLLRARFAGTGGASPPGGRGAPANGDEADSPDVFPMTGADRSFVTAFLSCFPFVMSVRRAPYDKISTKKQLAISPHVKMRIAMTGGGLTLFVVAAGGGRAGKLPGGGGGGGPPMPT